MHNQLQLARPVLGGERQRGGDHKPGPDQLPRILKAQALMQLELKPPVIDPDEPPPKPTGEKITEILKKKNVMQDNFDRIIDRLIDDILWGSTQDGKMGQDWTCSALLQTGDVCARSNAAAAARCSYCKAARPANASILDIKLDHIIHQTVSEYARTTVAAIMGRMKKPRSTRAYTTRAALAQERGQAALVRLL